MTNAHLWLTFLCCFLLQRQQRLLARAACALSGAYCTCDARRKNVTCTQLNVAFDELMYEQLPVNVEHLLVRDNYVDDEVTLREEQFTRVGYYLNTLNLVRLKIVSVSQQAFR